MKGPGGTTRFIRKLNPFRRAYARILLSRAKHRSLHGHPRIALRLARWAPAYSYSEGAFFASDGAPSDIQDKRRQGFKRLASLFRERSPQTLELSETLETGLSDLAFVNAHRVPFPYRRFAQEHLKIGSVVEETDGAMARDADGHWSYDLGGAYGVNLFGSDFYKGCIDRGVGRARALGLTLGPYHPIVADNVARLKAISGLDEVSFHMSGTEAVMQAVRLARYHTGRSHVVRFSGAYHGWWDGVQAGAGNPRPARDVYTLKEMDPITLRALACRDDIACVLVNPIQAMSPNALPAADSTLIASDRNAHFDREAYTRWLRQLRDVCTAASIPLIFDDVFLGFRLARGGAQEYFGVQADMVTYGKSLGGGLPVGVLCGKARLMRRFTDDRSMDICFARGTFNSHPYVMATMNEFLRYLDTPDVQAGYSQLDDRWNARAQALNERLERQGLPVRVANMTSVWTTLYTEPSRYNWMFQYYLRAEGLSLSWIGTGRMVFSHDLSDDDFARITDRFVDAAEAMRADGWWWREAALTNRQIKRRVLWELIQVRLGRVPPDLTTAAPGSPGRTDSQRPSSEQIPSSQTIL
jgi:glutamate-1-semialdehyde 2,1-aminomutase